MVNLNLINLGLCHRITTIVRLAVARENLYAVKDVPKHSILCALNLQWMQRMSPTSKANGFVTSVKSRK